MITILDSSQLAALAAIGGVVPAGVKRNYKAVGAHNDTAAAVTLTVHLVPTGGIADNSNRIINRLVPVDKTDMCPELVGRGLNAGGTLYVGGAGLNFGYTAIDTITG